MLEKFETPVGRTIYDSNLFRFSLWNKSGQDPLKNGLRGVLGMFLPFFFPFFFLLARWKFLCGDTNLCIILDWPSLQRTLTSEETNNPGKTFSNSKYSVLSDGERTRLKKIYNEGTNKKSNGTDVEHDFAVRIIEYMSDVSSTMKRFLIYLFKLTFRNLLNR